MEDLVFSIKALAALKNMSIKELAENCGIDSSHLMSVSSGRATITLKDAKALSVFTGVPISQIKDD